MCRAGFAADTEKGLQNLVQPLDLLSVAGSRIHIVVQCRLQHLVTDLLPDEILIETVVQQMRNVGFSQLVRGTALDLQLVTEVIQLHFDVVRRLNVEKVYPACMFLSRLQYLILLLDWLEYGTNFRFEINKKTKKSMVGFTYDCS